MDARWTIEELDDVVADLTGEHVGLRTLRYYATFGLLSRPSDRRGRKAFYGERHVLELVAVKKLQAQGVSLAAAQARLAGIATEALRTLAELPRHAVAPAPPAEEDRSRDDEEFWASPSSAASPPAARARLVTIPIHGSVTITIATSVDVSSTDTDAIHAAAAAVVTVLRKRGVIPPEDQ